MATDGRRLALIEKQAQCPKDFTRQAIVPNKAVGELNRILQETGSLKMVFGENQIMFSFINQDASGQDRQGNIVLISRLIEGEFPNYEQVIPKEGLNKIKVSTQKLFMGTKRAALLTNQDSQSMRIDLLKDKMVISKNTPELGEVKDQMDVVYSGKEMSIGFNPHYLMDALKNLSDEELVFEVDGPDKAGVIRTQQPAAYVYLVLPMQLG